MNSTKSILLFFVALCVITFLAMRSPANPTGADHEEFRKGEIVVEIKPGASIEAINRRQGTATIERIFGTNFYRLHIPQGKSENKWVRRLARDADVLSASLNPVVMSPSSVFARVTVGFPDGHATPGSDRTAYLSQPELFNLLNLSDAQLRSRGQGVVVAVIDTGIARTHPDLVAHLWRDDRRGGEIGIGGVDNDHDGLVDDAWGWDFVDNDNDPTEQAADPAVSVAGHGTFIAGLLALIAPECRIMPIRAFTADGMSNAFTVAAAIKYATDHGANVINLSFGSPSNAGVVREAIKYARQNGAILVAAMGNENQDTDSNPQYPAVLSKVMGVAAIDRDSHKADFSNFGSSVRVDALGVELVSTYPSTEAESGGYAMWSGTSFAAPLAAAEAALLLAEERQQNTGSTIEDTAVKIDHLNPDFSGKLGRGRIDPLAALDRLLKIPAGNYVSMTLMPGPGEVKAGGGVGISVTGSQQEFEIVARSLNVRATYRLIVDGKDITPAKFTTNSFGGLEMALSTDPKSTDETGQPPLRLPAELDPVMNIKHVELRDGDRVVLEGNFAPVVGGIAPSGQRVDKRTPLAPTDVTAQTNGKAHIEVDAKREELCIEASGLLPGASYKIVVDGIDLGRAVAQAQARHSAYLRVQFTNNTLDPTGLPPALQPVTNIKHVELRDLSDRVILQGDFLPGGGEVGGNH
jgi:hypothetical protein